MISRVLIDEKTTIMISMIMQINISRPALFSSFAFVGLLNARNRFAGHVLLAPFGDSKKTSVLCDLQIDATRTEKKAFAKLKCE